MRRKGFTLIELTVALALAVVLLGIVVVRVDGWSARQELRTTARALGNVIRHYREKAMAEERVFHLVLDLEEGTFSVTDPTRRVAFGPPEPLRKGNLGQGRSLSRVVTADVERKESVVLGFGPRGVIPETVIELGGDEGQTVTLTLDPLVNRISYEEGSENEKK